MLVRASTAGALRFEHSSGIALVQVLVIVAILSVMGLSFTRDTRDALQITRWNDDRIQAELNVRDAEAALLYELITVDRSVAGIPETNSPLTQRWNFWGDTFDYSDTTKIAIQDQSSLLHVNYPEEDYFVKLAVYLGYSPDDAAGLLDEMLDWQDLNSVPRNNGAERDQYGGTGIRNGAVPSVQELRWLRSIQPSTADALLSELTLYRRGGLNLFNASTNLIGALTTGVAADQIKGLRDSRSVTIEQFKRITGIEESFSVIFANTNFLGVDIESQVGESSAKTHIVLQLNPKAEGNVPPVIIYKRQM